jgi:hypothetical protein
MSAPSPPSMRLALSSPRRMSDALDPRRFSTLTMLSLKPLPSASLRMSCRLRSTLAANWLLANETVSIPSPPSNET